jgi:hypothetical protein
MGAVESARLQPRDISSFPTSVEGLLWKNSDVKGDAVSPQGIQSTDAPHPDRSVEFESVEGVDHGTGIAVQEVEVMVNPATAIARRDKESEVAVAHGGQTTVSVVSPT